MAALLALQAGAQTIPLTGDLNIDNEVNITDINLLIHAIFTGNGEATCDLNGDGAINITDLSALLGMAMAVNPEPDFEIGGEHATSGGSSFPRLMARKSGINCTRIIMVWAAKALMSPVLS